MSYPSVHKATLGSFTDNKMINRKRVKTMQILKKIMQEAKDGGYRDEVSLPNQPPPEVSRPSGPQANQQNQVLMLFQKVKRVGAVHTSNGCG